MLVFNPIIQETNAPFQLSLSSPNSYSFLFRLFDPKNISTMRVSGEFIVDTLTDWGKTLLTIEVVAATRSALMMIPVFHLCAACFSFVLVAILDFT